MPETSRTNLIGGIGIKNLFQGYGKNRVTNCVESLFCKLNHNELSSAHHKIITKLNLLIR